MGEAAFAENYIVEPVTFNRLAKPRAGLEGWGEATRVDTARVEFQVRRTAARAGRGRRSVVP